MSEMRNVQQVAQTYGKIDPALASQFARSARVRGDLPSEQVTGLETWQHVGYWDQDMQTVWDALIDEVPETELPRETELSKTRVDSALDRLEKGVGPELKSFLRRGYTKPEGEYVQQ